MTTPPTTAPRVLVLAIATTGEVYDGMRRVLKRQVGDKLPKGWSHKFVYAGDVEAADDQVVAADVEESLVPGVARKTLTALKLLAKDYDYVIRTNLSTLWMWDRLEAYIQAAPRTRLFAGTVDRTSGEHVCGCCMIWSRDVVDHLLQQWDEVWDSTDPDDVVLTRVCARVADISPVPRLDVYGDSFPGVQMHHAPHPIPDFLSHVTHLRFKSPDRYFDAATMDAADLVLHYLRREGAGVDLLLTVHLAQCMVLAPLVKGR